jgi:nucleoside-diphosphate-sugar epimerase
MLVDPDMDFPTDPTISASLKYHASKILAHRATLDWVQKFKPHFNVITLHPSFVFGGSLTQNTADELSGTNAMLWGTLFSEKPGIPCTAVDVKDVAAAHLKALVVNVGRDVAVQEFLLNNASWTWERVAEFVKEKYPSLGMKMVGPFNVPPEVEAKRAEDLLGLRWRTMEETLSSVVDQQLALRG